MERRIAKIINITKNNGNSRKIFVPTRTYSEQLKNNFKKLNEILLEQDKSKVNHAFLAGRNCVTNAMQHIGYQYCLQLDIEDFFDSISSESVKGVINNEICNLVFIEGKLKQGLPTSPIISNIAFIPVDKIILNFVKKLDENIIYTRYADDLTFSFNDIRFKDLLYKRVVKILANFGFKINHKKTKFQMAVNGNIIVTGVAVNSKGVFPTRKTKRKLRAIEHQYQKNIEFLIRVIEIVSTSSGNNEKLIDILKILNIYYKEKDNVLDWSFNYLELFLNKIETVFKDCLSDIYISDVKALGQYYRYYKYNSVYANGDSKSIKSNHTDFKWIENRNYRIKLEDILNKCNECRYNFYTLIGFRGWASCALPRNMKEKENNK